MNQNSESELLNRKAFQEWCRVNKPDLMGDWDGKSYVDYEKTELAWQVWKAATIRDDIIAKAALSETPKLEK